ncbi:3-hydroxyacyl-CoA dehydrogenase family protein [Salinibacterium sp. GXW1014]|uniref:3-hydroxyacyl-CoA dehydrogenase family protein n=1 Tax=Salinibacterium sp. GXW1014 TaxID=3377838 RepID=UPI00383A04EF
MRETNTVMVVGAGAMGAQIALLCAARGLEVTLTEVDPRMRETAIARITALGARQVEKGRLGAAALDGAIARISTLAAIDEAPEVDLAIEAVTENRELKRKVLGELDMHFSGGTIIASNSSSFVPSSLTDSIAARDRFLNIHFFNPVLSMRCVEVIACPETSADTLAGAIAFVERIDRLPLVVKKEIPGFIANRILNAVRDEALHLYEGGYADIEAIDLACRHALGYPMGPFELMDLTGIDIGYLTKVARHEETGNPADAPSTTVARLVEQGTLGRKTGQGFYHYDDQGRRGAPAI